MFLDSRGSAYQRRRALLAATLALIAPAADSFGQTTENRELTLREQLVFGLQVRRPVEFAYIDAVIDTVERDELPESLVLRVFAYARSRQAVSRVRRRPIITFQAALDEITKKLRIDIRPDPAPTA
ncbi:hypothetical protein [Botrimarina sp.]|uniref:hypothetical protein n=1 Tax=Botrimarina sp. TaxID=2795802 RepID=UPI0032ECF645